MFSRNAEIQNSDLGIRLLAIVLIAAAIFWGINRPFYTRGEAREALAAQAMVAGESWILPRVYDGRVPSKPPFTHWIMAAGAEIAGDELSETAARLPSALAASFFAIFFFCWAKRRLGNSALLSTLILFSSIEWARAAVTSRVDMVFSVAIATAALAAIDLALGYRKGFSQLVVFAALTVGFLTKGPAAWVLVGAFTFGLALYTKNFRLIRDSLAPAIGSVVVPGIWYFLAYQVGGDDFLAKVVSENFARFAGTMEDQPHVHGVFYLVGVLLVGLLPWSVAGLKPIGKAALSNDKERKLILGASFALCCLVFVFFAVPSSKRSVYLLPMYPAAALLITEMVRGGFKGWVSIFFRVLSFTLGGVVLAIICKIPDYFQSKDGELIHYVLEIDWLGVGCGLVAAAGLIHWAVRDGRRADMLALWLISLLAFANGAIVPRLSEYLSPREFSTRIVEVGIPEGGIQSYQRDAYGVAYYSKHQVSDFKACADNVGYVVPVSELVNFAKICGPVKEQFRSSRGVIKPRDIWSYVRIESRK